MIGPARETGLERRGFVKPVHISAVGALGYVTALQLDRVQWLDSVECGTKDICGICRDSRVMAYHGKLCSIK